MRNILFTVALVAAIALAPMVAVAQTPAASEYIDLGEFDVVRHTPASAPDFRALAFDGEQRRCVAWKRVPSSRGGTVRRCARYSGTSRSTPARRTPRSAPKPRPVRPVAKTPQPVQQVGVETKRRTEDRITRQAPAECEVSEAVTTETGATRVTCLRWRGEETPLPSLTEAAFDAGESLPTEDIVEVDSCQTALERGEQAGSLYGGNGTMALSGLVSAGTSFLYARKRNQRKDELIAWESAVEDAARRGLLLVGPRPASDPPAWLDTPNVPDLFPVIAVAGAVLPVLSVSFGSPEPPYYDMGRSVQTNHECYRKGYARTASSRRTGESDFRFVDRGRNRLSDRKRYRRESAGYPLDPNRAGESTTGSPRSQEGQDPMTLETSGIAMIVAVVVHALLAEWRARADHVRYMDAERLRQATEPNAAKRRGRSRAPVSLRRVRPEPDEPRWEAQ